MESDTENSVSDIKSASDAESTVSDVDKAKNRGLLSRFVLLFVDTCVPLTV